MGPTLDTKGILVDCVSCARRNRLAYKTLGKETRCGNCKTPLEVPGQTIHVATDEQFEALIGESRLPVLIDFWADWCGPCKMLAPELEKVAARAQGQVIVAKINTEYLPESAGKFRIQSIPTLALMRDGLEVERIMGARPANDILDFLERLLR
ncbi:MAG TPA: thioredoxin [Verrucomicrobiae bacterium]